MLIEAIPHPDYDMPVRLSLISLQEYPIHHHSDMELIYVLKGEIEIKATFYFITLKENDIYLINSNDLHCLKAENSDNLLLILHVELDYYSQYNSYLNKAIFSCNSQEALPSELIELSKIKNYMIDCYIKMQNFSLQNKSILNENVINILLLLINNFQFSCRKDGSLQNNNIFRGNDIQIQRFHRIVDFIYENYTEKITLDEIAVREFMSKYYLTRLLKEGIGMGFQEMINFVRVENSERLLLGTTDSIENIAYAVGFSTPAYFSKNFIKYFGITPNEHRIKYTNSTINNKKADFTNKKLNQTEIFALIQSLETTESSNDLIKKSKVKRLSLNIKKQNSVLQNAITWKSLLLAQFDCNFISFYLPSLSKIMGELDISKLYLNIDMKTESQEDTLISLDLTLNHLSSLKFPPTISILGIENNDFLGKLLTMSNYYGIKVDITNLSENQFKNNNNQLSLVEHYSNITYSIYQNETIVSIDALLTKNGLLRKTFMPFYLLNKMGTSVIDTGTNHIIAKYQDSYQILLFNSNFENPYDQLEFILSFTSLSERYILKQYTLTADILSEEELWEAMGAPAVLTSDNLKFISKKSFPILDFQIIENQPEFNVFKTLKLGDVSLFILEKLI